MFEVVYKSQVEMDENDADQEAPGEQHIPSRT